MVRCSITVTLGTRSMDEAAARALIAEHLAVPRALVVDAAHFRDLGADSLDIVTLTMQLEEAFDLHVPDEQVDRCTTVGEAIEILRAAAEASGEDIRQAERLHRNAETA